MAKKRRSKSVFRGKVTRDVGNQEKKRAGGGYLNLPKGIEKFDPDAKNHVVYLDFIPYEVTDKSHPDRDVRQGEKEDEGIAGVGSLWYKRSFKVHKDVGADNERVVCPTSVGKLCPICEYRKKRFKEGADKDETDALRPIRRNLYNVIPLDYTNYEEKPYVWDISDYLFQKVLNEEIEVDESLEVFPDLEEGFPLKIRIKEGTFAKNSFVDIGRIDAGQEREEPYDESILDDVANLDEVLDVKSYEELETLFFEQEQPEPDDDEEEDDQEPFDEDKMEDDMPEEEEEEKPKSRTRKAARSRKPVLKEPEEEEPEEEEEEPEEEEEEKPKPKKKTTSRKPKSQSKAKKKSSEECPYNHEFGVDTDEFPDDCDQCDIWDKCIAVKEESE